MLEDDIDSFWELSIEKQIAYVSNRIALGVATILGA
jgi:hypothetical protein